MKSFMQTLAFIGLFTMLSFNTLDVLVSDKDCSKFISEVADARMMDFEQGKLAMAKGTTDEIKIYGKLMMIDQTMLLAELKKLAESQKMLLPSQISEEKMNALLVLKDKKGTDFDKKFLSMMTIDHKRDVKVFTKAKECSNKEIKAFATKFLPMIESHLVGVETIIR